MTDEKGHCKHGDFDLREGCEKCLAEKWEKGKVELKIKVTAPEDAPAGEEEKFAGELIHLAEIIAEVQGAPKPEIALALRPGEDVEVRSYHSEALRLLDYAERRAIATLEDSKTATDDLTILSTLKKAMEAKKKEKLEPSKLEAEAIRDTYTYLMGPVLEAEKVTKEKQTAFLMEQRRIQQAQEAINQKRLEAAEAEMKLNGELSESVNLVEVSEAPKRVSTDLGTTGLTDHWVYEVTDFALLPDEYKVPDTAMLTAVARKHHDQKPVKGVRFYNQPYIATRSK